MVHSKVKTADSCGGELCVISLQSILTRFFLWLIRALSARRSLHPCRHANRHGLPSTVTRSGEAALLRAGAVRQTEVIEAPLEVFIQKGVQHGVQAAVGVAQGDAQMPAGYHQEVLVVDLHHGLDNDEDVDGGPADDESRHDHQNHARDAPQVPVLLLGAGQQPDVLQPQDHQAVADGDDEDWHHKGADKHADFHHGVPVPLRLGKSERAGGVSWGVKQLVLIGGQA